MSDFREINKEIIKDLEYMGLDPDILSKIISQNPFTGENLPLKNISLFYKKDRSILEDLNSYEKESLVFLFNIRNSLIHSDKYPIFSEHIDQSLVEYAFDVLDKTYSTQARMICEDVFFEFLEPETYSKYKQLLGITFHRYEGQVENTVKKIKRLMTSNKIDFEVKSRIKTIYSTHKKVTKKNVLFSQVLDIVGIRLVVSNIEECYKTMDIIKKKWQILESKTKDYIRRPKINGYKSIHITILMDDYPVEIQIRTKRMDNEAEYGKWAHSEYKNTVD